MGLYNDEISAIQQHNGRNYTLMVPFKLVHGNPCAQSFFDPKGSIQGKQFAFHTRARSTCASIPIAVATTTKNIK